MQANTEPGNHAGKPRDEACSAVPRDTYRVNVFRNMEAGMRCRSDLVISPKGRNEHLPAPLRRQTASRPKPAGQAASAVSKENAA